MYTTKSKQYQVGKCVPPALQAVGQEGKLLCAICDLPGYAVPELAQRGTS